MLAIAPLSNAQTSQSQALQQQSLRLMLSQSLADVNANSGGAPRHQFNAAVNVRHIRYQNRVITPTETDLFRYQSGQQDWSSSCSGLQCQQTGYEIDRLNYRYQGQNQQFSLGRQALNWGAGHLWQPLNIFTAFMPSALDTDYQAGIDGAVYEYYPSAFSSLTGAYITNTKGSGTSPNLALYYRGALASGAELSLLAAQHLAEKLVGFAYEDSLRQGFAEGMGWRIEARLTPAQQAWFSSIGLDYQFAQGQFLPEGLMLTAEWYHHNQGVTTAQQLNLITQQLNTQQLNTLYQPQPQLAANVLGVAVSKTLSPLWQGNLTHLTSLITNAHSQLLQLSVTYSVSNESDLLIALNHYDGASVSEFGSQSDTAVVRLKFYF